MLFVTLIFYLWMFVFYYVISMSYTCHIHRYFNMSSFIDYHVIIMESFSFNPICHIYYIDEL